MRIAVIADIHGNILALEAVLDDLARRGGADRSSISATAFPARCGRAKPWSGCRRSGWPTVRGNHDRRVALDPLDEMGPSDKFAYDRLTQAQRDWLVALPLKRRSHPASLAFHARPDHDERYLLDAIVDGRLVRAPLAAIGEAAEIDRSRPTASCSAATAIARELLRMPDGLVIFNPGSVGCPAYDDPTEPAHVSEQGSPHARYGIVELGEDGGARPVRGDRRRLRS